MNHRIINNDEEAVSPVIAVILMVAITVVMAAVLYAWLGGIIGGSPKSPPTGSMMVSSDGASDWTVTIIKMNPTVSVNSVHWFLLDMSDMTKIDGMVSDIYGFKGGEGEAVIYVDNDFDAKVSPGDHFQIFAGEDGTSLEQYSDLSEYSFRMKFDPTGDTIGYDTEFVS
jgi:flagellin-like protein